MGLGSNRFHNFIVVNLKLMISIILIELIICRVFLRLRILELLIQEREFCHPLMITGHHEELFIIRDKRVVLKQV